MPKTLAEINEAITAAGIDPGDLTNIIAAVKSAVRESDAGVIASLEKELESAKASRDRTIADLQGEVAELKKTAKDTIDQLLSQINAGHDAFNSAIAERDAQIARAQELAKAAKAARERRKAADSAYVAIDAQEDAIIAEASKGMDEQEAAAKEAKRAALEAELAKLA